MDSLFHCGEEWGRLLMDDIDEGFKGTVSCFIPCCQFALSFSSPSLLSLLPASLHSSCHSRGTEPQGQLIRERCLQQHDWHTVAQLLGQGLVSLICVSADEQGRYCTPGW